MFSLKNKEQFQPKSQTREQGQYEKKGLHFGQSYDYFDRHRRVIKDESQVTHKQKKRTDYWTTAEDEVFFNMNALESDQCQYQHSCEKEKSYPSNFVENSQYGSIQSRLSEGFLDGSSPPTDSARVPNHPLSFTKNITREQYSKSVNPPENSFTPNYSPESTKSQLNLAPSVRARQRPGFGTRFHPGSPSSDHFQSPTTPDEGYSTGTNSTTSISSPLSASLASVAFFDQHHPQSPSKTLASQENQAMKLSPYFEDHNSKKSQCSQVIGSNLHERMIGSESLTAVLENPVLRDHSGKWSSTDIPQGVQNKQSDNRSIPAATTMQRGPIQKGPSLNHLGRKALHTLSAPILRRRDVSNPHRRCASEIHFSGNSSEATCNENYTLSTESVASIEDQIKMLTTIQEEDVGSYDHQSHSNVQQVNPSHKEPSFHKLYQQNFGNNNHQLSTDHIPGIDQSNKESEETSRKTTSPDEATGFFRAMPVQILQPRNNFDVKSDGNWKPNNGVGCYKQQQIQSWHSQTLTSCADFTGNTNGVESSLPDSRSGKGIPELINLVRSNSCNITNEGPGWHNYQKFFEKDVNIPDHNFDPALNKKLFGAKRNCPKEIGVNAQLENARSTSSLVETNRSDSQMLKDTAELQNTSQIFKNDHIRSTIFRQRDHLLQTNPSPDESSDHIATYHTLHASNTDLPIITATECFQNSSRDQPPQSQPSNTNQTFSSIDDFPEYYNTASSMIDLSRQQNLSSSSDKPQYDLSQTLISQAGSSRICRTANQDLNSIQQHQQWSDCELTDHRKELLNRYGDEWLEKTPTALTNQKQYQLKDVKPSFQLDEQHCHHQRRHTYHPQGISELQDIGLFHNNQASLILPHNRAEIELAQMRQTPKGNLIGAGFVSTDLYLRHPGTTAKNPGIGALGGAIQRSSLDLGNLPQLHKQIRASSELCLQTQRRHMFASSADIHKLFSSHRHRPAMPSSLTMQSKPLSLNPSSSQSFHGEPEHKDEIKTHRHSYCSSTRPSRYATLGNTFQQSPSSQNTSAIQYDYQQSVSYNQESMMDQQFTDPIPGNSRGVHDVPRPCGSNKHNPSQPISNHSLGVGASYDITYASSVMPTNNNQSFYRNNPALGIDFKQARELDLGVQSQALQRQSSGYSSETELQQIEYDAKLEKKHFCHSKKVSKAAKEDLVLSELRNPNLECKALNTSADKDSITTTGTDESIAGAFVPISVRNKRSYSAEPVYVNQIMLGRSQAQNPLSIEDVPPPLPARRYRSASVANDQDFTVQHPYSEDNSSFKGTRPMDRDQITPFFDDKLYNDGGGNPSRISSEFQSERFRQDFSCQQNYPPHQEIHQEQWQHSINNGILKKGEKSDQSVDSPALTQNQVINFQNRPVSITSHIPFNSFTQESKVSNHNTQTQHVTIQSQGFNTVNNHTNKHEINDSNEQEIVCDSPQNTSMHNIESLILPQGIEESQHQTLNQKQHFHSFSTKDTSNFGEASMVSPTLFAAPSSSVRRSSSRNAHPLSPVELAQVLEVPFATSIISDEQGDRLSTLV